jgi:RimJ/RimL family protein N-acetyltransferase
MIVRAVEEAELERVLPLLVPDPACTLTAEKYRARLGSAEYRVEWTWAAEESAAGPPLALGVWWGTPRDNVPAALDGLWVRDSVPGSDRAELAAELLTTAHRTFAAAGMKELPDFHVFLPGDWNDRPEVVGALGWRRAAARQAGLTESLERLRYEWRQGAGLRTRSDRLVFRAEPDDEVFAELFRQVLAGTLDETSHREAGKLGPQAQARQDVEFYRDHMIGDRAWWRVAERPGGELAGFGLPSRNQDVPVVGYLGVLPGHRGHGYAVDILAEITRILVAEARATIIRADTDLQNRPMASAFEQAGYQNFARRLVLSAP